MRTNDGQHKQLSKGQRTILFSQLWCVTYWNVKWRRLIACSKYLYELEAFIIHRYASEDCSSFTWAFSLYMFFVVLLFGML